MAFLGWVDPIEPLVERAAVLVMTSRSEGFPMLALEAMALGRPVVATRVGGLPEIVADGETGVLVAPGDEAAAARAMSRLLADAGERRRMGTAARHLIVDRFTQGVMTSAHLAAYRRLLDRADTARVRE
ncbi:MAG: glycosyltransferase family 4 protein [Actinobacteria bacterium]|nr:MAG: glycosyltransferase family 4 protein [Actinomycetota bacterium]